MAGEIDATSSVLLKDQRLATTARAQAQNQLSSGLRVQQPGDDVTAFESIQKFQQSSTVDMAQVGAAQSRMSWYQASESYLQSINGILSSMSSLAVQASSSTASPSDVLALNNSFQQYKTQISQIVDGNSGASAPSATFNGRAVFIGYAPPQEIGADVDQQQLSDQGIDLFTGQGRPGFSSMQLVPESGPGAGGSVPVTLSGSAQGGSTTTLQLDSNATTANDVYVGMQVQLTGGTGAGQSSIITAYDGATRTATLSSPLATAPDSTTSYTITSNQPNSGLVSAGSATSVTFAENVWGADASRTDNLNGPSSTFIPVTDAERQYRLTNNIPDSNLQPQTDAEKLARRKLNIFDPEFGNLSTTANAQTMIGQVQAARDKISLYMQQIDAKAESVQSTVTTLTSKSDVETQGANVLSQANIPDAVSRLQNAALSPEAMTAIAARFNRNQADLTQLVRAGGNQQSGAKKA